MLSFLRSHWKKIIAVLLCLAVLAGAFTAWYYLWGVEPGELETVQIGDGETLRVGIISDSHMPRRRADDSVTPEHLRQALELMKEQDVELILHAGDIVDFSTNYAYRTYTRVFDSVFGDAAPETLYIMGNHDLWFYTDYESIAPKQRKFARHMEQSPYLHKVVNGFHFIAASANSPQSGHLDYTQDALEWMEREIQSAVADTPDLPVFVITHQNPQDTSYGSDIWFAKGLDEIRCKYSNVVSISGHSHFSIMDERAIHQESYTAMTTQGLSSVGLGAEYFDAFRGASTGMAPLPYEAPFMMILDVSREETVIQRWSVLESAEVKAQQRWVLSYPLIPENFTYTTEARLQAAGQPEFTDTALSYQPAIPAPREDSAYDTLPGITFQAARDADLVTGYLVSMKHLDTGVVYSYTYCSDYYLGESRRSETVELALNPLLPRGAYDVAVYAVNSFGNSSENCAAGTITLQ
ncbi:MAG: metallophosphoesterase [Clostridiales bacterium]|nr:metallophosphoesterase [Clostridiales bacterium]